MNLHYKSLKACFLLSLFLTLMMPSLLPTLKILFFAPVIIISYYKKSHAEALIFSLITGLILDLGLSQERFGLYALDFTITTALLYAQKQHFFADSLSTLPIMTFFFSILSTLIQVVLMHGLERDITLSWHWAFTDLLVMPLADALFAFVVFIFPFFLFGKRPIQA